MELKDIRIGMKVRVVPKEVKTLGTTPDSKYRTCQEQQLRLVVTRIREGTQFPIQCSYLENNTTRIFYHNEEDIIKFVFDPDELILIERDDDNMLFSLIE